MDVAVVGSYDPVLRLRSIFHITFTDLIFARNFSCVRM